MSRRRPAVSASVIYAPLMTLAEAIDSLPIDNKTFNSLRYRWVKVVRSHPMLTAAERHVALAIAQQYINRSLGHYWFNSAWAAHQTLAEQVGLTRRTVVSAMATLRLMGLIAVEHGGGSKVVGGRTDRYTLRTDWLDVLERAAQIVRQNHVKSFHASHGGIDNHFEERCEKDPERGEIDSGEMGNSPSGDVKGLRTTISNTAFLEGLSTRLERPSETPPLAATPQAANGRKESSERVTEQDHLDLASLLGKGNVEEGFCRLCSLDEADANQLALLYRRDRSLDEFIRAEAVRLEEKLGRPG